MDMIYTEEYRRYVIASLDDHTLYVKVFGNKKYGLIETVSGATKYDTRKLASQMISYYKQETGDTRDFVVLPVLITYDLIDETEYTLDGGFK